jgi:hypothetical protein
MKQILAGFMERFEAMSMAVTFAEAGEWSTAKRMLDRGNKWQQKNVERRSEEKTGKQQRRMRVY